MPFMALYNRVASSFGLNGRNGCKVPDKRIVQRLPSSGQRQSHYHRRHCNQPEENCCLTAEDSQHRLAADNMVDY
ncbi:unnamed protein product [Sphagnum tenellum]